MYGLNLRDPRDHRELLGGEVAPQGDGSPLGSDYDDMPSLEAAEHEIERQRRVLNQAHIDFNRDGPSNTESSDSDD